MDKYTLFDIYTDNTDFKIDTTKDFLKKSLDCFFLDINIKDFINTVIKLDFSKDYTVYNNRNIKTYSVDEFIEKLIEIAKEDKFILDYFDFEKVYAEINGISIRYADDDGFIIKTADGEEYLGASEIVDWIEENFDTVYNYIIDNYFNKKFLKKVLTS